MSEQTTHLEKQGECRGIKDGIFVSLCTTMFLLLMFFGIMLSLCIPQINTATQYQGINLSHYQMKVLGFVVMGICYVGSLLFLRLMIKNR